jgi:hypothetical protein
VRFHGEDDLLINLGFDGECIAHSIHFNSGGFLAPGACGAADVTCATSGSWIPGSEDSRMRYLRAFRKRKNEGFSGHNGVFLAPKEGKKRDSQLLIRQ